MKRKIDAPAELRRALNLYLATMKLRSRIQQAYVKAGAIPENGKLFNYCELSIALRSSAFTSCSSVSIFNEDNPRAVRFAWSALITLCKRLLLPLNHFWLAGFFSSRQIASSTLFDSVLLKPNRRRISSISTLMRLCWRGRAESNRRPRV